MLKRIKHFLTGRLHRECMNNDIKAVKKRLAKEGVDVNMKCPYGDTPLHYATTKEMVQVLVEGGADVNAQRGGDKWTALHSTCSMDCNETAEFLIANGAIVNSKDKDHLTPLDYTVRENESSTAVFLRKHGGKLCEEL
jgi:ankyrin repeat protein